MLLSLCNAVIVSDLFNSCVLSKKEVWCLKYHSNTSLFKLETILQLDARKNYLILKNLI